MSLLNKKYLTVGQSAKLLGVSNSTIRRWINQNIFSSFVTVGGHNRILEIDILDFKNSSEKVNNEGFCGRNADTVINRSKSTDSKSK